MKLTVKYISSIFVNPGEPQDDNKVTVTKINDIWAKMVVNLFIFVFISLFKLFDFIIIWLFQLIINRFMVPRNNIQINFLLLIFLLVLSLPVSANKNMKVYKHVDKDGIIHYSSKKPVGKSYNILNVRCPECSAWRSSVNWNTTPLINNKFSLEIETAARKHDLESSNISISR